MHRCMYVLHQILCFKAVMQPGGWRHGPTKELLLHLFSLAPEPFFTQNLRWDWRVVTSSRLVGVRSDSSVFMLSAASLITFLLAQKSS